MTKTEITKRCRDILYHNSVCVPLKQEDYNFLIMVFSMHPEWDLKTKGQNIKDIIVGIGRPYGNRCFYIKREDGTQTDISYLACLRGVNHLYDVIKACRTAISPKITQFISTLHFPIVCPIDGTIINSPKDMDVDHYDWDFNDVVRSWIALNDGVEHLWQFVNKMEDNNCVTEFTNRNIALSWQLYHDEHTHLRAISKHANRSVRRKKQKD